MARKFLPRPTIGQKFGYWEILSYSHKDGSINWWDCLCRCGTTKLVRESDLKQKKSTSCGCKRRETLSKVKSKNLINQKFTKLMVTKRIYELNKPPKWLCSCDCGKTIVVTTNQLTSKNTKSCGCLRSDINREKNNLINQKFGRLTVKFLAFSRNNKLYWNCECICGKTVIRYSNQLKRSARSSCGCRIKEGFNQKDFSKQIFNDLTVIKRAYRKKKSWYWLCECKCGKRVTVANTSLGHIIGCGCTKGLKQRKNLSGLQYGKLTALYPTNKKYRGKIIWKCLCECGRESEVNINQLNSGNTKSCGSCGDFINGKVCSQIQKDLRNLIGKGKLNYDSYCGKNIDIVFFYKNHKIAVEYDSWLCHGNQIKKDRQRNKILVQNGWKLLIIRSSGKLPTKKKIYRSLNELVSSSRKRYSITMSDWGKGKVYRKKDT